MKRYMLLFIALCTVPAALAVDLPSGGEYEFNYTNSTGSNESELFACLEPENATVEIVLDAGGSLTRVEDHVRIDASCNPVSSDEPESCRIRENLEPGDEYRFEDGSCDVQISVDEYEPEETELGEYEYEVPFTLKGTNDTTTFSIDGMIFEQTVLDSYTIKDSVTLSCPETVNLTNRLDADDAMEACAEYAPLLLNDWIRPTLESCRNDASERADILENCSAQRIELEREIAEERVRSETLAGNLSSVRAQLENSNSEIAVLEDRLDARSQGVTARNILLILETIALLLVGGFAALLFFGGLRRGDQ